MVSFLEELEVNLFHMQEHIMSPIIKMYTLLILRVHVYVCVTVSHLCVRLCGVLGATVFDLLICFAHQKMSYMVYIRTS